jgi:hypothetical protein
MPENEVWEKASAHSQLAIAIDFQNYDPKEVLRLLRKEFPTGPSPQSEWTTEEGRLLAFVSQKNTR